MFIESLIRLAETLEHFRSKNEFLVSEKFHKETEELIESQTNFLIEDLKFRKDNPGPYNFGLGDLTVSVFSPEETDANEWAAIARKGDWQKTYRFSSIMGMVKILATILEEERSI